MKANLKSAHGDLNYPSLFFCHSDFCQHEVLSTILREAMVFSNGYLL